MARCFFCLAIAILLLAPVHVRAQDGILSKDDGPPIAITSPDTGSTYIYGTLKGRQLYYNKQNRMLFARVTFTDSELADSTPQDDTMDFRLPGVSFDEARGLFSATTAKGEVIPIAHIKKTLFIKSIEILPNARVRVIRDHGNVSVILEAISPNDPAMHPAPINPDGTHSEKESQLLN
jgi:hypothetical protein